MTKPFRIALKVWLCAIVISISTFHTAVQLSIGTTFLQISAIIFIDIIVIGIVGAIIFWEKLTG